MLKKGDPIRLPYLEQKQFNVMGHLEPLEPCRANGSAAIASHHNAPKAGLDFPAQRQFNLTSYVPDGADLSTDIPTLEPLST
jgi:hypothetical protein